VVLSGVGVEGIIGVIDFSNADYEIGKNTNKNIAA
jgi:hypothetical protein